MDRGAKPASTALYRANAPMRRQIGGCFLTANRGAHHQCDPQTEEAGVNLQRAIKSGRIALMGYQMEMNYGLHELDGRKGIFYRSEGFSHMRIFDQNILMIIFDQLGSTEYYYFYQ